MYMYKYIYICRGRCRFVYMYSRSPMQTTMVHAELQVRLRLENTAGLELV